MVVLSGRDVVVTSGEDVVVVVATVVVVVASATSKYAITDGNLPLRIRRVQLPRSNTETPST